jgi:hypothetical protein
MQSPLRRIVEGVLHARLGWRSCRVRNAPNAQVMRNYARERVAPVLLIHLGLVAGGEEEEKNGEEAGKWSYDGVCIENCASTAVRLKAAIPLFPFLSIGNARLGVASQLFVGPDVQHSTRRRTALALSTELP